MIHASTLEFLSDLSGNNNREWFEANKKRYEASKKDVTAFVNELISGIITLDGNLAGLEAKDCMFRIFRDVRFSANKAPYKSNMGAWMARGGRKSLFAGYYLHLEPGGKSFLAGGSYMPAGPVLESIREAVDFQADEFLEIVQDADFLKMFGQLDGEKLKTAPKGFAKDHPMIEFLRHKSFTVSRSISDAEVLSPEFLETALETYAHMTVLNRFLNLAIGHVAE